MVAVVTGNDLDTWSRTRDAEGHLPTLVRRLIVVTAGPEGIRMPAAEAVRTPGFDGRVFAPVGCPPWVPAGASVWELSTQGYPSGKANGDYDKRTRDTSADERARTTYVAVTSRAWPGAKAWAAERRGDGDGWADVQALAAEELATWLESYPGLQGWLAEHLGRAPWGATALRDWFADWCEATDPALPSALLLAGRDEHCAAVREVLTGPPATYIVYAATRDEAAAAVAAALVADPPPAWITPPGQREAPPSDTRGAATGTVLYESVLERAIVVHDTAAWRELVAHDSPLVLVSLLEETDPGPAVRRRHHVVVPIAARPGDPTALPRLHRERARVAWEQAGVGYPKSDELAVAARRSMGSLRRRHPRHPGQPRPAWSSGADASLLAAALLAQGWEADHNGDQQVLTALCDRSWRGLSRDLARVAALEDPPVQQHARRWLFVDPIDAWDHLRPALTGDGLDLFHEQVQVVLGERDPYLDLPPEQRWYARIDPTAPAARIHSGTLRAGMASTLAILGAIVGDRDLGDGSTGQAHADGAVHQLLDGADRDRWLSLAEPGLLASMAEAAPEVFLDAVEASLDRIDQPVVALMERVSGPTGQTDHAAGLLRALDVLGWSPRYFPRAVVALARLMVTDPPPGAGYHDQVGEALTRALHLQVPRSAVAGDDGLRLRALDLIRRHRPTVGFWLAASLVRGRYRGTLIIPGPRFRDWSPEPGSVPTALDEVVSAIAERLREDAGTDPARWAAVLGLYDQLGELDRRALLRDADSVHVAMPQADQRRMLRTLHEVLDRHTEHHDQPWAMSEHQRNELQRFLARHQAGDSDAAEADAHELFVLWPPLAGMTMTHPDYDTELARRRVRSVRVVLDRHGLAGVLALAHEDEVVPEYIGETLSDLAGFDPAPVLDLLGGSDQREHRLAGGLAQRSAEQDFAWLADALRDRPDQAVDLLVAAPVTAELLDLLEQQGHAHRRGYWARMQAFVTPRPLGTRIAARLLEAGRAIAAVWVLGMADGDAANDLTVQALQAAVTDTTDSDQGFLDRFEVVVPVLMRRLQRAVVDQEVVAGLEWAYLPVLRTEQHPPLALYAELARDPDLFVAIVQTVYLPANGDDDSDIPRMDPEHNAAQVGLELLRAWRDPLPGSPDGTLPTTTQIQQWVRRVSDALIASGWAALIPRVIGEALSGPATDPDETWPSAPVRDVLEAQHDPDLEDHLSMARNYQRGGTTRGVDGGDPERGLSQQYRDRADVLRDRWRRAARVLDDLSRGFAAEARYTDQRARDRSDQ